MSDSEKDNRDATESSPGGSGFLFVVLCCMSPMFYVLSIGPVCWLAEMVGMPPRAAVRMFYYPVIWLHDHTFLAKPLEWYVEMWEVR